MNDAPGADGAIDGKRCSFCEQEASEESVKVDASRAHVPAASVARLLELRGAMTAETSSRLQELRTLGEVVLCRYCMFRCGREVMLRELLQLRQLGSLIGLDDADAGEWGADTALEMDLHDLQQGLAHLFDRVLTVRSKLAEKQALDT
jgi:hypothetical protein